MPEMKDSGIEWIGKIPINWKIVRFKYLSEVLYGYPLDSKKFSFEGFPMIRIRDITSGNIETFYDGDFPEKYIVKYGDVLLGMDGDFNLRVWKNVDAVLNQRCCSVLGSSVCSKHYLFYSMQMPLKILNDITFSTTVKHLLAFGLDNLPIVYCSFVEQNRIVNYLDAKNSKIASLYSDIEKQIDVLEQYKKSVITEAVTKGLDPNVEMKDSGIEWIGQIPKDWEIAPVYSFFGERHNRNYDLQEQNLLSLSYGKIVRKDINTVGGLLPASFNTYNVVEAGDIIIRPTDLQNDKRSLRTGLVTEHGIITSAYIDLKPEKDVNSRYFHYLLHTYDVLKVFYNMGNGVRQGLNYSEFAKLKVFAPSVGEQQQIADYLDAKCDEIDSAIAEKKKQLETLEAYKKSLIYEYVTGKKEVSV